MVRIEKESYFVLHLSYLLSSLAFAYLMRHKFFARHRLEEGVPTFISREKETNASHKPYEIQSRVLTSLLALFSTLEISPFRFAQILNSKLLFTCTKASPRVRPLHYSVPRHMLPKGFENEIDTFNSFVFKSFRRYLNEITKDEEFSINAQGILPLSKLAPLPQHIIPPPPWSSLHTRARSEFSALASGKEDSFGSILELERHFREKVVIDPSSVPIWESNPDAVW